MLTLHFTDYVYSAISFEQRDGGPYSIGRILEFLPASDAPKNSKKIMRARLAWVFRLQDMDIRSKDPREVVPAMISETVEVRALRGKCFLLHKDEISDLQAWKKRPDRFWFNKMFDPFIKETYELILSSDVRNGEFGSRGGRFFPGVALFRTNPPPTFATSPRKRPEGRL